MSAVPVSKVLHARNLAPATEANDLRQFVSQFGQAAYVVMLPKYQQALIEMVDEQQAAAVIRFTSTNPVSIRFREVVFSYSKSKEIKRTVGQAPPHPEGQQPSEQHNGEHTLLMTIVNPLYAINVGVIHSILHSFGNVLRIVIFHKNGTQALAEFDNPESALRAKQALDGKDIYDGCCTLRISFSKVEKLNVRTNTDKTRDFTNPNLPTQTIDPQFAMYQQPIFAAPNGQMAGHGIGIAGQQGLGSVLMAYNFPPKQLTCDRVFNLFCLYGNVIKVKMLTSKEGAVMVQMGDKPQAEQALRHLNAAVLDGQEIVVTFSKHPFIADGRSVMAEADSTPTPNPTCKDYSNSSANRFNRPNANVSRHIYHPTNVLFFSNASPNATEDLFHELFSSLGLEQPTGIKFFPPTTSGTATTSSTTTNSAPRKTGLLEFSSVGTATMAVFVANNQRVDGHTIKLAFSMNSF
eukprot:c18857_g1_i4.p1 GENE.c18857_g1_i4~~c18857_g1_i4.p1  ORF type:complete len:463 (-),score=115.74 c18857_g1_i4:32-1420(-)